MQTSHAKYVILKTAIERKLQVSAEYGGLKREFCPHALGTFDGELRCWAYQFAGESASGLTVRKSPRPWRCFKLNALELLDVCEGQ